MADIAVSATLALVEIVVLSLNQLNLHDVQNKIESMKKRLESMKAIIEENNGREMGRWMEHLMAEVRDTAYEIEDVLDKFLLHSRPYTLHNHKFTRKVHSIAHRVRHVFSHHGISKKIEEMQKNVEGIIEQLQASSRASEPSSSSSTRGSRNPVSPLLLDDEMIGYENQKNDFNTRLLDEEENLVKLVVVGYVGSGKTTFVKNVFWKQGIYGKFDCHAWVNVSQNFDAVELFTNMLKQFCSSRKEPYPSEDSSDDPKTKLRSYLDGKRYIVVLDDVWKTEDWEQIKDAFPNTLPGNKIIVTTRSSDVAVKCASSRNHTYILNGLEWLEGWKLFCKKAFPDPESNGECPSELENCSTRIVQRCEGLPLAIVAIGAALAHKPRFPNEWERFHNNIGCEIKDDSHLSVISNTLLPGYLDLPTNLKSCFLYFSIFPEDYSVKRGRLIRLWVAERFAKETVGKTAEEVAQDYLNELIHRNLVHVSNWDFDGRPRNCRVLNLVLKFIIQKCKDENFASICHSRSSPSPTHKIRRLSVHNNYSRDHLPQSDFGGVRSKFLLRLRDISVPEFEKHLREMLLLRVLDLQGAPLTEFSEEITCLALLRYLSLSDTRVKTIPKSIKKLSYLETLDLKQTDVTKLPKEISHLHNLRHLIAYKYNVENYVVFDSVQGVKVSKRISELKNLQDLSLVEVDEKGKILKDLENLTQLRKLGLKGLKGEHCKDLCASIEHMKSLTTLDLCSTGKQGYLELGEMGNPPRTLERLYLKGRLKTFPAWISSLDNLFRIGLKWSKLQHSPLDALKSLPYLMELQLVDCCIGPELIFEASCFKKMKILLIEEFPELNKIEIQDGAMPDLKQISLRKCPQLMMLPQGMRSLAKVEELTLHDMAEELKARIRSNGEDRAMVTRIPVIHSFTLNCNRWQLENLSNSYQH